MEINAAFTLSSFDDQEGNLTFVKTCVTSFIIKISCLQYVARFLAISQTKVLHALYNKKILFYKVSVRYLVVKPVCVNAA